MKNEIIFYNIRDDLELAPDAAIYIVIGGRSTGKTYSALKYVYESCQKFIFMKRTNKDVSLMCDRYNAKTGNNYSLDMSPYKSLNCDMGWNVRAYRIQDGLGGFWNCDPEDNAPIGDPVGYVLSFNSIAKFKGFDLSDCDYIIFDEFIPMPYERLNRDEGIELMDLYRTVGRANNIKYGKVLKLICLANSTTVSCPVLDELELTDTLVDMKAAGISKMYIRERCIYVHILEDINGFREVELKNPIYKAMRGTKWAKMSLENDFAYNDFSCIRKQSIKGYACICSVHWRNKYFYVYAGPKDFYMTDIKSNHPALTYDLDRESDQKRFYITQILDLKQRVINNNMYFKSYTMYNLVVNYTDFFKV